MEKHCKKCSKEINIITKGRIISQETREKLSRSKKGKLPNNFKGIVLAEGYKLIYYPEHPKSFNKKRYIREHRLVMEKNIGRILSARETVHHINGDRGDNRIENLMLFSNKGSHLNYELGNNVKTKDIIFNGGK